MFNKVKIIIYVSIIFMNGSCKDFLEEEPHSFIAPENFYQNENDALAALVGAYVGLGDGSNTFLARRVHYLTWFASDECYPPRLGAEKQLDNFTYTADHTDVNQVWTQMYDAINRANIVIEKVVKIDMDESVKQQYIAEARFVRALSYFFGVRLWGPLPLITTEVTAVDQVSGIERAPESEIYDLVISDLESSFQYLPTVNQDGKVSLGAAKGLLAKVYLTKASSEAASADDYQRCADLLKKS